MKIVTGSCFHAASASKVTTFYGQGYITSLQEGHRRQIMIAHRGRFERFRRRRQASIKLRIKKYQLAGKNNATYSRLQFQLTVVWQISCLCYFLSSNLM